MNDGTRNMVKHWRTDAIEDRTRRMNGGRWTSPETFIPDPAPARFRPDDALIGWLAFGGSTNSFVLKMKDELKSRGSLSARQGEVLVSIYEKAFDAAQDEWDRHAGSLVGRIAALPVDERAAAHATVKREIDAEGTGARIVREAEEAVERGDGFELTARELELLAKPERTEAELEELLFGKVVSAPEVAPATTSAPAVTETIPTGYYTVVMPDGSHVTLRISEWKGKDATVVGYLAGSDNTSDYVGFGFVNGNKLAVWNKFRGKLARQEAAFAVLAGDVAGAGEAYALASSHCFRCNRLLTVPASLHRGLGPECAKKAL